MEDFYLIALLLVVLSTVWLIQKNRQKLKSQQERQNNLKQQATNGGKTGDEQEQQPERELEEQDYFDSFALNKVEEITDLPYINICTEREIPYMSEVLVDHLHQYGFAVIKLNDEDRKLVFDMFKALQTFMENDTETKLQASSDSFSGYSFQKSLGFESFQFKYNDDPNFKWPTNPPNFESLARKLLAHHLKCDPKFFLDDVDKFPLPSGQVAASTLRLFRYINKTDEKLRDLTHIDIDLITLLPASNKAGLQVEAIKKWVAVENIAQRGDLIFFPGSMLQLITNGYLKGTVHRVVRDGNSERYSMPIAFLPKLDSTIKVVDSPQVDADFEHNVTLGFKLPLKVEEFVDSQYRHRAMKRALQLMTQFE